MDVAHLHLALTQFPIIGTIIGVGVLAYGQYANSDSIKKVALVIFILMALLTIPVFLTGEEAEETVEHLSGVSENLIEEHEELAEKAIWLMGLLGAFSLISFYAITKKMSFTKTTTIVTLVLSLTTAGLFAVVGNSGGQIRHSEIRTNTTNTFDHNSNDIMKHDDDDD